MDDVKGEVEEVRPVAEVGYYVDAGGAMRGVVRSVGLLAVLFGGLGLALLPFELAYRYGVAPLGAGQRTVFYTVNEGLAIALSVASSACAIVGGIGCLRRRPRGRRLLLVWGWAVLAWSAYAVVLNGWYFVAYSGGRYPVATAVVMVGQQLRTWLGWTCLPVVVAALFGQGAVREVFEGG